jgi:hypothetical protein
MCIRKRWQWCWLRRCGLQQQQSQRRNRSQYRQPTKMAAPTTIRQGPTISLPSLSISETHATERMGMTGGHLPRGITWWSARATRWVRRSAEVLHYEMVPSYKLQQQHLAAKGISSDCPMHYVHVRGGEVQLLTVQAAKTSNSTRNSMTKSKK